MTGNAPAGWLPSAARPGELRYWNGTRWTTTFALNGTATERPDEADEPAPQPPAPPTSAPPATAGPRLLPPPPPPPPKQPFIWTPVKLVLLGVGSLAGLLVIALVVFLATRPTVVHIDTDVLNPQLESWAIDNLNANSNVQADCPDDPHGEVGDSFHCTLEDDTGLARVNVTIENEDGDVTWIVG